MHTTIMKTAALLLLCVVVTACAGSKNRPGVPVKVSEGGFNTALSYYNTSPESPDGAKIAYTKFLSTPKHKRGEKVPAEIWVCHSDLSNHRKVVSINAIALHNGARVQWLDNHSFAYQDDFIRAVDLDGRVLMEPVEGRLGHDTFEGRILYSARSKASGLSTIYEYDVVQKKTLVLGDVQDFKNVIERFPDPDLRSLDEMRILHLQYSPNGKKIAFRLDIGPRSEQYKHLVTMNHDGSGVKYFGPKPMHFSWFDNNSIQGHDIQIEDGLPNDHRARVWDLERNVIETLSGPGNHFAASPDRNTFASESWYWRTPVVLRVFKRGESQPFWEDTVSNDAHTTWALANHVNPSFSRDGNRVYYNKCVARGQFFVFFAELPQASEQCEHQ